MGILVVIKVMCPAENVVSTVGLSLVLIKLEKNSNKQDSYSKKLWWVARHSVYNVAFSYFVLSYRVVYK